MVDMKPATITIPQPLPPRVFIVAPDGETVIQGGRAKRRTGAEEQPS